MKTRKDAATGPLSPGDRDPTFGVEGVVRLRTPEGDETIVTCLHFLDDYRLLVGLEAQIFAPGGGYSTTFVLTCLNAIAGAVDESFGDRGFSSGRYSAANFHRPQGIVPDLPLPDLPGSNLGILLYGITSWGIQPVDRTAPWEMASLALFWPDGSQDGQWGINGTRAVDLPGDGVLGFSRPFVGHDGRLRLIGTAKAPSNAKHGVVVHLNEQGWLDDDVNDTGVISFAFPGVITDVVADIPRGFTVVGSTERRGVVSRIDDTGTLDLSFGEQGRVLIDPPDPNLDRTSINRAVALADGRTLAVGEARIGETNDVHKRHGLLAVLTCDGGYDPNFNSGEYLLLRDFPEGQLVDVAVDAEGRYVVAASLRERGVIVARLLSSGEVDTSFGGGKGYIQDDIGPGSQRFGCMSIDNEGRILIGGSVSGNAAPSASSYLVRYMG